MVRKINLNFRTWVYLKKQITCVRFSIKFKQYFSAAAVFHKKEVMSAPEMMVYYFEMKMYFVIKLYFVKGF